MLCTRCNMRRSVNGLCTSCLINTQMLDKSDSLITDEEIIDYHAVRNILLGCRECGSSDFGFTAGVQYEKELKWFMIRVNCGKCKSKYEELVEVRIIDEPDKHNKRI